MTEAQELKAQLVAVLVMSNEADAESDPIGKRLALEHLQRSIQDARPLIETYAVDLLVEVN